MQKGRVVYRHSAVTRLTHWLFFVSFLALVSTGLQIFNAAPYLDAADMQNFHHYFPMSQKAQACLEDRIAHIKTEAQGIVAELMESRLELDKGGLEYLTCAKVGREEWPWEASSSSRVTVTGGEDSVSSPATPNQTRTVLKNWALGRSRSRSPPLSEGLSMETRYRSRSPVVDPRLMGGPEALSVI